MLREIEVYAAQVECATNEFTGSTLAEAVARSVYDYHGNNLIWWVGDVQETSPNTFRVTCNFYYPHWGEDAADDPFIFRMYAERRTMFVPCEVLDA